MTPDDRELAVAPKRRRTRLLLAGLSTILTASCFLFSTENRYAVQGSVETCHHLDGFLDRCLNEPSASKTIVLDGLGGRFSTDYSSDSFRFDEVLEGGYELSLSHAPGYLERIGADSIWAPAKWVFVPPPLLNAGEYVLTEWVFSSSGSAAAR